MRERRGSERRIAEVPPAVGLVLIAACTLQIGWHAWRPDPHADVQRLAHPPPVPALRIAAFGDDAALAKLLMLRLQAHDEQPGASVPFMHLDYERVAGWLDGIIELDPRADSPMLAAARLYGSVPDPIRQRTMFELVHRRFLEDPDRRWPWLAHAAVMAKHRLGDYPLALRYASALSRHATGPRVPAWVRDMGALVAADLGEVETAWALVAGLVESGRLTDPQEIRFLAARLAETPRPSLPRGAPPSPVSSPAPPHRAEPGTRSGNGAVSGAAPGSAHPARQ